MGIRENFRLVVGVVTAVWLIKSITVPLQQAAGLAEAVSVFKLHERHEARPAALPPSQRRRAPMITPA